MPNLPWAHRTICQMSLVGTCLNVQVVAVHHFEASAVLEGTFVADATAVTAASNLGADWETNLKDEWVACHSSDYTLLRIVTQIIERPATFRHRLSATERVVTTGGVGTGPSGVETLTTAAVLKWQTPIAGKSHRGRTYIGPTSTVWMTDGRLSGTGVTTHTAYGTAMIARYGVGGTPPDLWNMTVYSRPYNMGEYQYATRKTGSLTVVTPPDYAGNSTNITGSSLDLILRSQRRREIGVGG